ncbi:MAG: efflux RND transporter permease subunit [Saprospiraceae bacterium]|nr:efflux RND transporter permease subunit [Saprospiraceae bacterium]
MGKEISKFKQYEDEFPIQLRYSEETRSNINNLLNLKITFMDLTTGMLRHVPLSSVASIRYTDTYGGINRQNLKRIITISSDVTTGYSANDIVPKITKIAQAFPVKNGVQIKLTGRTGGSGISRVIPDEGNDDSDRAPFLHTDNTVQQFQQVGDHTQRSYIQYYRCVVWYRHF